MGLQFLVDKDRCTGCGECVKDCPVGVPMMNDGAPVVKPENEPNCVGCQHCMAICSTGALSIMGLDPDDPDSGYGTFPTSTQTEALMKGRRSVRRYRNRPVSREKISLLLETALFAPTAVNNRQVMFTVVDRPERMEEIRQAAYAALHEKAANGKLPPGMEYIQERMAQGLDAESDFIFRGAPHLLIASSPKDGLCPEIDCVIALTYFELMAASMGLGALWCGMARTVLTLITPEILTELGVPSSHKVGYVMLFGEPDVAYQRIIQPGKPNINWVGSMNREG